MICPHCGKENDAGRESCVSCGSALTDAQEQSSDAGAPVSKSMPKFLTSPTFWVRFCAAAGVIAMALLIRANFAPSKTSAAHSSSPAIIQYVATPAPEIITTPNPSEQVLLPSPSPIPTPTPTPTPEPPTVFASVFEGSFEDHEMLRFSGAEVSSALEYNGRVFGADYAIDGNIYTSWQEGVSGRGIGEWLKVYFAEETSVAMVTIEAGYTADETIYYKNCRPKDMKISFSDGTFCRVTLEDKIESETFIFDAPVITSSITFTIESSYEPTAWDDNVITDIAAYS